MAVNNLFSRSMFPRYSEKKQLIREIIYCHWVSGEKASEEYYRGLISSPLRIFFSLHRSLKNEREKFPFKYGERPKKPKDEPIY